jgi:hypothetical protein
VKGTNPRIRRLWRVLEPFLRVLGDFLTTPWWNALWEPLLLLWEKSFEYPLARFCPPFVQVLGAIWLGLPDERLKDLLSVFGFDKTGGRWPYETITVLVLVILSTIYGAEYGYRLQTALSLAATDTAAQSARTDAAARNRDAQSARTGAEERDRDAQSARTDAAARNRDAQKSIIYNRIREADDAEEREFYLKQLALILGSEDERSD